jgi:hypothetical protein
MDVDADPTGAQTRRQAALDSLGAAPLACVPRRIHMVKGLIALTAALLFLAGSLAAAPDAHAQASKSTLVDINSASDDEL